MTTGKILIFQITSKFKGKEMGYQSITLKIMHQPHGPQEPSGTTALFDIDITGSKGVLVWVPRKNMRISTKYQK